jgi:hypothetical protein
MKIAAMHNVLASNKKFTARASSFAKATVVRQ